MHAATFFDGEEWRDGVLDVVDGRPRLRDGSPTIEMPRLDGAIVGGFTDHHVHLQLVDHTLLPGSTLTRVIDLGANPASLALHLPAQIRNAPESANSDAFLNDHGWGEAGEGGVGVAFAGAFLTAVGGYPSDRAWAPAGSVREIADLAAAEAAVNEMADAGAACIKVASNSSAGPVFDDHLFRAIVELATGRQLPVVAHAEGAGQAQRAARLGASRLAHAPFSERLDDREIDVQATRVAWISTLAIHEGDARSTAIDNTRRFHAAGGTVLYGTDMGNGLSPVGLNSAELNALRDAGLHGTALWRTLAPQDPRAAQSTLLLVPGGSTADADPFLARPLVPADLKV